MSLCFASRQQASGGWLRATDGEGVAEADEVVDVQGWRRGRSVAVGAGFARGEEVAEADEVVDVEDRGRGGAVAVGVAGRSAGGEAFDLGRDRHQSLRQP